MAREIRARFSKGKLEPLESLDGLKEGDVVTIAIKDEWPAWKREVEEAAKKGSVANFGIVR